MQEMYPFASEAQEMIKQLKGQILQLSQKQDLSIENFRKLDTMVQERMKPLEEITSRMENMEQDKEKMIISMNRERGHLKKDIELIDSRIGEVDTKMGQVNMRINAVETTAADKLGLALAKIRHLYDEFEASRSQTPDKASEEKASEYEYSEASSVSNETTSESSVEVALAKTRTGMKKTRSKRGESRQRSSTPRARSSSTQPLKRKAPSDHSANSHASSNSHSSRPLARKSSTLNGRVRRKKKKRARLE
jgi:DNA repair exonuclease SbcCD ATPase subunit